MGFAGFSLHQPHRGQLAAMVGGVFACSFVSAGGRNRSSFGAKKVPCFAPTPPSRSSPDAWTSAARRCSFEPIRPEGWTLRSWFVALSRVNGPAGVVLSQGKIHPLENNGHTGGGRGGPSDRAAVKNVGASLASCGRGDRILPRQLRKTAQNEEIVDCTSVEARAYMGLL